MFANIMHFWLTPRVSTSCVQGPRGGNNYPIESQSCIHVHQSMNNALPDLSGKQGGKIQAL